MSLFTLSRAQLAAVGREYMLFGHLLNRGALPHVHVQLGAKGNASSLTLKDEDGREQIFKP